MRAVLLLLLISISNTVHADELFDRLNAIPKVSAAEITTTSDRATGIRRFSMLIEQPIDHFNPGSGTFKQKLILFHRSFNEPMILQTSGYAIFDESLTDIATLFETNQLQIEHRYFLNSTPSPIDWSNLTVRQSAEDFHRVVELLKPLYSKNWIGTGKSKGGITSVAHRYFYPNDLNGTFALVAPLFLAREDSAYSDHLTQVGGPKYAQCRQALRDLQILLLKRKATLLPMAQGVFTAIGSKELAFEHAVILLPEIFWANNPDDPQFGCAKIPSAKATDKEFFNYMEGVSSVSLFSDFWFLYYRPYHYQSAFELGFPAHDISHLKGLLNFPYNLDQYLEKPVIYDSRQMKDISDWVRSSAKNMLFIYGEFDFWSGRKFEPNTQAGYDNHVFIAPRAGHNSNLSKLAPADSVEAKSILGAWLGKPAIKKRVSD